MIPEFPNFIALGPQHIQEINNMVSGFPEYSDYNPASLLAWDVNDDTQISNLHGNLVVRFRDYMDGSQFMSLLGTNKVKESMRLVSNYAQRNDIEATLKLVPQETMDELSVYDNCDITSDRDNYDYVIGLEEVSRLEGKKFRKVRREINTFAKRHGDDSVIKVLDLGNASHVDDMLSVFHAREALKPNNDDADELAAMQRLIRLRGHFSLVAWGVYINDKLEAFVLMEQTSDTHLVEHFCKGNTDYYGINQHILVSFCREYRDRGFTEMNIEQDLGIHGLRHFKEELNPIAYRKKYSIELLPVPQHSAPRPVFQQLAMKLQLS